MNEQTDGGPKFPSTASEYITAMAHFHRAEIARMAGWRDRIDRTSNWAITVVAAMLSVSLSTPTAHHGVLLFAMLLVLLLLVIEARRYRFFDVYRSRVRMLERNYYANILAPLAERSDEWALRLSNDLRRPQFFISQGEALTRRMRRNYIWMFLALLLAWLLKLSAKDVMIAGPGDRLFPHGGHLIAAAAIGPVPGEVVIGAVALFHAWIVFVACRRIEARGEFAYGEVHV